MIPTKTLQLNVGVFEATDSVRKSVATYGINLVSSAGEFRDIKTTLAAGQSKTFEGLRPTSGTVLHVSRPVQLRILKDSTATSPSSETIMLVRRVLVWDETYSRIVVTALGQDVYLTLHQA